LSRTIREQEDKIKKELEIRLPQIRYALEFHDWKFGLNHLRHLEKILPPRAQTRCVKK